jgi:PKD repeat protein
VSYSWSFGDDTTATTASHTVTHTYRTAGRFTASVTESDAAGTEASASGTIALFECPASQSSCSESLTNADGVQELETSGPISASSAAGLNLFVGPFRIPDCQLEIVPTAALTDSGFTGNLTVTLEYTSSFPSQARTTCFSSTVPFVNTSGHTVTSGRLPMCAAVPTAPCVESVDISGSSVTKELLIPPGDPKVGAP